MASVMHFEIPVDDLDRAQNFYQTLFDWKYEVEQMEGFDYVSISTQDHEGKPGLGGGMMKRMQPDQQPTNYIGVASIDETLKQVEALGGQVLMPKEAIKNYGWLALCLDTEKNVFGLWENNPEAMHA